MIHPGQTLIASVTGTTSLSWNFRVALEASKGVARKMKYAVALLSLLSNAVAQDQAQPRVVHLDPPHLATEVDATTTTLTVTFDQDMDTRSYSFCGGGPSFPRTKRGGWKDKRNCVLEVTLQPDHDYVMQLNCRSSKNFRSSTGAAATPTPWIFSTKPLNNLDEDEQRALNHRALRQIKELLPHGYSYYERVKIDWADLFDRNEKAILEARSARGFAVAMGAALAPARDLHLYLRYRNRVVATSQSEKDTLFRYGLLGKYLGEIKQPSQGLVTARTKDGIGYLLIATWTATLDAAKVEEALAQLQSSKSLIVDVRPNRGGDELIAQQVAAWFVDGTKTYAKHVLRTGEDSFGPIQERRVTGNKTGRRFTKPVTVLMSQANTSSNEAFLLMMRQAKKATLVGQRSHGSSGNPKSHELANGVQIFIPRWKALRADGSCFEGEGITPDIHVASNPEQLETRDPVLEKALSLLRTEEKGSKKRLP